MSLLVTVVTSEMRMLFNIKLLSILAGVGIIGNILLAFRAITSLVFGGTARIAHTHTMRFGIPNCSQICTVSLHKVVQVDVGVVEVKTIEVFGDLELCSLRSTLERLHEFAHYEVCGSGPTTVEFALR